MTLFQIARNRLRRDAPSFAKASAYAQGFRSSLKLRRDKSARQDGAPGKVAPTCAPYFGASEATIFSKQLAECQAVERKAGSKAGG